MHRARGSAVLAAVALVASLLSAAVASAGGPSASLVLELRPTSDRALDALATARHLSAHDRARRVAALIPDGDRRATVARIARSLGLQVRRTSTWSLQVSGPTATVTTLFGTVPPAGPRAAGRAYPTVPPALAPYVVAALPASGRVASPLATASPRDGTDFRTAYSAPAGSTGAGLAVATVQLSGWNAQDLARYAKRHGFNNFDIAKQYAAISVAGASTDHIDGMGGDEEVALDQEAILATAPDAVQVAYFAPNNDGGDGYVSAIHQVGQDAAKFHTAALSLSWGGCEASDQRAWLAAMDAALKFTLAAGVTVFAASGDQGSQDCVGEIPGSAQFTPAVDFPASSPYVVGVGGTTLPPSGSTAPPLGWSGSGGGESSFEPLPAWQNSVASRSPDNRRLVPDIASDADPNNGLCVYETTTREQSSAACSPGEFMLAGTSLASPTQAALLADTLAAAGWTSGIGDIHSALYAGTAAGALTDVIGDDDRSGNGTYHAVAGYDLVTGLGTPVWTKLQSWLGQFDIGAPRGTRSTTFAIAPRAAIGYAPGYQSWSQPLLATSGATADCSTTSSAAPTSVALPADAADGTYTFSVAGMAATAASGGTPACHVGTASVVLDRHAPRTALSVAVSAAGLATAKWWFGDAAPSSGLQKFVVVATSGGQVQWTMTTTNRSRVFNVLPHTRWNLRVTAYDNAGNTAVATAHLYDDGAAFTFGTGWKRVSAALAFRRSFALASRAGSSARVSLTGQRFVLYVTTCPACGKLAVFDGHGRRVVTIDTYSSRTRYRVPVTLQSLTRPARRTFVVRVLASKNTHSRGHDVGIDAFAFN